MFHSFKSQTYKNFVRPNERLRSFLSGQELSQERTEPDSHSLKFAGTILGKKKKRCIFCNKWTKLFPILSSPHCSFQQAMCYSSPGLNPSCTRQTGDTNVHWRSSWLRAGCTWLTWFCSDVSSPSRCSSCPLRQVSTKERKGCWLRRDML